MVGRGATLDRVRSVIELADLGTTDLPSIALVAGEAGIGKTRLLRELIAGLPADVTVLSASAEPGSLARPFDVARQLAAGGTPSGEAIHPAEDALAAVGHAAHRGRVALVIEDLHWIDADSVAVLDAIARQPWPNVVIVATYRPTDLRRGAPGGDLVSRLERRNEVEQFRLDRLDRNEVGAMMSAISMGPVSSAAVEAVYRRSGGVPFVIEELLRCAGPDACSDDIVSVQLPWSLEEAVRKQLADLSPAERAVVDALGVYGAPAPFELLAELTGLDERELLGHLRGLVERGVVEESRDDRLWFAHALLADAVPHQLLGRERRRLHERCFEILGRIAPDHHAELARHAAGAGRFDEIVAIAREGSRHYLDRGASFQALRLACEGLAEDCDDADLLAVATQAAWRLDFLPEALEHAIEWQRVARSHAELIDATRYVARLHHELGREADSEAVTAQLVEWAEAPVTGGDRQALADRARAEAAVAQMYMLRHHGDARLWADRAIDHAREAGDRPIEVQAMVEKASSLESRDLDRTSALVGLRAAADAARSIGDGVLLGRAINNMIDLLQPNGDECKRLLRQLRQVSNQYGLDKFGTMSVLWWEASSAFADGDLSAYRRLLEEWFSWSPTPRTPQAKAGDLADLALEEGRLADARAILGGGQPGEHTLEHDAMTWLELAALDQDATLARQAFDAIAARSIRHDAWVVTGMVVDTVLHALSAGITPTEIRERLLDSLDRHPARATIAGLAEGPLRAAEGRIDEAVAAFDAIDRPLSTLVARPYEGTYLLSYAQTLLAAADRDRATSVARRAVEALSRWPGWRRDRAEALLARLEGSARTSGELTPRETEVAALIAEGLTNGQLAERLYISPKTAAVHVSNILAKLGLSSRAEVAAWAVRHAVVPA